MNHFAILKYNSSFLYRLLMNVRMMQVQQRCECRDWFKNFYFLPFKFMYGADNAYCVTVVSGTTYHKIVYCLECNKNHDKLALQIHIILSTTSMFSLGFLENECIDKLLQGKEVHITSVSYYVIRFSKLRHERKCEKSQLQVDRQIYRWSMQDLYSHFETSEMSTLSLKVLERDHC